MKLKMVTQNKSINMDPLPLVLEKNHVWRRSMYTHNGEEKITLVIILWSLLTHRDNFNFYLYTKNFITYRHWRCLWTKS